MRRLLTFIKCDRFVKSENGGALAELAILIPFLIIMVATVSELGRLFQTYTALSKSTRAAARYLSKRAYDNEEIARAKNMAVCGKPNCDGVDPLVPNLTVDNIVVTPEFQEGGGGGNPITVSVTVENYAFQPIFNLGTLIGNDRFMSLPASSSTTMYYMWIEPAGVEE
jgi:Flp pilus assembly protein TadG